MKTITINTSHDYEIYIENGIFSRAGKYISSLSDYHTAVIISDSHVYPLYGNALTEQLTSCGVRVLSYCFPAGEASKNMDTYYGIVGFLAENAVTRSDILIALGGGVVGDITGFVAATYLRGIDYVQIPTTLLAMVDSSVGGKTAIDLPQGKNLLGAFYQPRIVICDPAVLDTLPEDIFCDGCAEVIKYAVLFDLDLFDHLNDLALDFHREEVIAKCVSHKRDIVSADEFDRGCRQLLNLGHTFGHGVEACSNYTVSHGQAVAMGMAMIAKASYRYNICAEECYDKIVTLLSRFHLPVASPYSCDDIFQHTLSDKKRSGHSLNLIVPLKIGHCEIRNYPIEDIKSMIQAGL